MNDTVMVLDSDTLSKLSLGHAFVQARARNDLERHGRQAITVVTVFERLHGDQAALRAGKPFEADLRRFRALAASCVALAFDDATADRASVIWAGLNRVPPPTSVLHCANRGDFAKSPSGFGTAS